MSAPHILLGGDVLPGISCNDSGSERDNSAGSSWLEATISPIETSNSSRGQSSSDGDVSSSLALSTESCTTIVAYEDAKAANAVQSRCPIVQSSTKREFEKIQQAYPTLRSVGCSEIFCQSGRMIKTDEPRVGQDRPMEKLQEEAMGFLQQLKEDGIINGDDELEVRRQHVFKQIQDGSIPTHSSQRLPNEIDAEQDRAPAIVHAGGTWHQYYDELRHGVQLAWKHSSKCIMRSEYSSLELRDFRPITSSAAMGKALVDGLRQAFNKGDIIPTVFAFPPRQPGKRGPMIWNGQLLSFAAYEQADGTILGDPANTELTKAIMEIGWVPPAVRTRWDLLPLVTMAEGDKPAITEISEDDFPLVQITHPRYRLQFEKLGLQWVAAPALSQLGFDIGGVQYTATPFIGWFMDAEIGVRNLADKQRYNMLPDVCERLGWVDDKLDLEHAPEHEKMALLSKAQAELTYAVYHSFRAAGIMMSDTLSASSMYCNFDDEHFREYGFRLPSNPYYIAPPQGSIVPIWHRGGAPNYQPTPLIAKHVQNPVKAWRREKERLHTRVDSAIGDPQTLDSAISRATLNDHNAHGTAGPQSTIHIFYCSAATTARKLADDLHRRLAQKCKDWHQESYTIRSAQVLNQLRKDQLAPGDKLLIIASTSGQGEIPANGKRIEKLLAMSDQDFSVEFSVFGNGSSSYKSTYNDSAKKIVSLLTNARATPIGNGMFEADTAIADPPWRRFDQWVHHLSVSIGLQDLSSNNPSLSENSNHVSAAGELIPQYRTAKLVSCRSSKAACIRHVTLDVGDLDYDILSHIHVLVPNENTEVRAALGALRLNGDETLPRLDNITTKTFLTDFADFGSCFVDMDWAQGLQLSNARLHLIKSLPMGQALTTMPRLLKRSASLDALFSAMPMKQARIYSVASSHQYLHSRGRSTHLELLIQGRHNGLVSRFLASAKKGQQVRIKYTPSKWESLVKDHSKPMICFATGSGLAPVRSLLQERLHLARQTTADAADPLTKSDHTFSPAPVSLFLGFREIDSSTVVDSIQESIGAGIVDLCLLTPSNSRKVRAQDKMFDSAVRNKIIRKIKDKEASVLVCGGPEAAEDFRRNLDAIVGCDVQNTLGERYVQEVFKPAT